MRCPRLPRLIPNFITRSRQIKTLTNNQFENLIESMALEDLNYFDLELFLV